MDLETATAFVNSRPIQRYIEAIDRDADTATTEAGANFRALSALPSRTLAGYRQDLQALERAMGEFNGEWNRIVFAQARDGRAGARAYSRYVLTLGILEQRNAMFGARVRAGVFTALSALSAIYLEQARRIRRQMQRDIRFLRNLDRELVRARRELKEAHAQRVINVAITAVSMCITVATFGAGLAVAGGIFATQTVVDAALGPSGPSLPGNANNATGAVLGLPGMMSNASQRFAGAAGGVISFSMDTDEITLAETNIVLIRDMMRRYQRAAPRLDRMLRDAANRVRTAQAFYEGTVRQARAEARSYRSHENQRRGLIRELERLE
ncbi:MAG: hypothetical protein AAF865_11055 [Pseudomonadota bacterium]